MVDSRKEMAFTSQYSRFLLKQIYLHTVLYTFIYLAQLSLCCSIYCHLLRVAYRQNLEIVRPYCKNTSVMQVFLKFGSVPGSRWGLHPQTLAAACLLAAQPVIRIKARRTLKVKLTLQMDVLNGHQVSRQRFIIITFKIRSPNRLINIRIEVRYFEGFKKV